MSSDPRWSRCIYHRGEDVIPFLEGYLSEEKRSVLIIGGAGFDPRASQIPELIATYAGKRAKGFFIREDRPRPDPELIKRATENEERLKRVIPGSEVQHLEVFSSDDHVVAGRAAIDLVKALDLTKHTDVFVDLSALSVGVAFPIVRYLDDSLKNTSINIHLVVMDEPATDAEIRSTAHQYTSTILGFQGMLGLDQSAEAARLWMPQLSFRKQVVLNLIHTRVKPHAVCPILPFPSSIPRLADRLIEKYGEEFQTPWQVDARDIVYANERSPVDLYRTILRIDDARKRIFAQTGGSQIILSPVGSKALAIGALMAALERTFTVMYVETISYTVDFNRVVQVRDREPGQIVHVWLHGEAYGSVGKEAESNGN